MDNTSIGDAKRKIADAAEHSTKAAGSISMATDALEEALRLVTEAAGEVKHELMRDSLQKFKDARESLIDAERMVKEAQEAAHAYADAIS